MQENETVEQRGRVLKLVGCDKNTKIEKFDFDQQDANQISYDLIETLKYHGGIGVSGPQVGINYAVLAMVGDPCYVCFNPRIIDQSTEEVTLDENDINDPTLIIPVSRPKSIKVRFATPNGQTTTLKFTGMTARIFQHCVDVLHHTNFIAKAGLYHRTKAKKNAKLAKRKKNRVKVT